ncbi:PREDICTED: zinc finger protein 37 homolog [Branchiostoma belcheri]|uniref:Zinc finger protein 37 homolog n=1 Tax=Branchiostoma belcheri TaxID=7741 RepID=A0A6P4YYP0_BRABE|nr:PREDICTED: zinc finger protein 37 homolog [Branchiostoma belcheri]
MRMMKELPAPSPRQKATCQNVEDSATGNKGETQKEDRNFEEGDTETHVDVSMESSMKNDSKVKNKKKQKKRKKLTQIDSSDCSSADEYSEVSDHRKKARHIGRTPNYTKPKQKVKEYRKRREKVAAKVACKYCNKIFTIAAFLYNHVEKHCKMKKDPHLCYPCRHVAYTSEEHEEHCKTQDHAVLQEIYKHIKESQEGCIKYRCTICEYQSGNMEEIEIHVPKHLADDGKVFPCNYCNKLYPSRYRRQLHIEKLHTKTWKKTAICDVCGKCFYGSTELNMHMRLHQGIKPHKCTHEGCTYRAKVPSELKTHMMRHAGEKPFLCDRCSYASVTKQGLTRHVRHVHTKPADKLLKCEQCGYTTMQAHNLTRHITTHTGEKPFKCPHCPYRCNDDGNLRKHILKSGKHKGVKLYNCKSCDFGTNRVLDFFNHQRGTHGMAIVEDYKGSFMSGTTIDNMNPRFHRVSSSNQQQGPAGGTTDKQEGEVASAIAAIVPNDDIPDVESEEMASDNTQPSNAVGILEDLVEEMSASLQTTTEEEHQEEEQQEEEQQEKEQQDTEMF